MIKSKIAESFRKLRLIDFKNTFERGDKVNVFVGDVMNMQKEGLDCALAEINPAFIAHIPKLYINMIVCLLPKPDTFRLPF